ncbi:hypothetical protein FVF58_44570 [Paraburkholderia panacisoli]|uniref:Uncharacterized protein n=1 Tax=Paraburkholderia panacisoli TaxID=2603818 RepID=A0A5B0G4K8_9BURK|nr:hypothetical protein [Paraburkholderia panacisoli]KAA0998453.1 hypothetical protein FVF58_44570 [Paraburkholderia panacisoli]
MTDLPKGHYVGELYYLPVGSPKDGDFVFVPGSPGIEIEQGAVKASLLSSPGGAMVSVQAVWQADESALESARADIATHYPDADEIRLDAAPLSDVTATLTIGSASGVLHTVGPNQASGMPSNRVVFSETLTAAEKLETINAFRGKPGVLVLDYAGTLSLDESATVEIAGDLVDIVKSLAPKPVEEKSGGFFSRKKDPPPPEPPTLDMCAVALNDAIASGRLHIVNMDTPNVSSRVRDKATDELRATLAKMLFDKLQQMGADAIYLSSFPVRLRKSIPESVTFQISRTVDLGMWFAQNGGARLVAEAGAPIPEPPR